MGVIVYLSIFILWLLHDMEPPEIHASPPYGVHGFAWIYPSKVIALRLCLCCQNWSKKPHFGQKLIKSIYFGSAESPPHASI
jgi:hypothetical protein